MAKGINLIKTNIVQSEKSTKDIILQTKKILEKSLAQSQYGENVTPLLNAVLQIVTQISQLALDAAIETMEQGEVQNDGNVVIESSKNTLKEIEDINEIIKNSLENLSLSSESLVEFAGKDIKNILSMYTPKK
ncbi:hypothetical protein [Cellulosilyticum sp. I15G10I2]|uniref:hypothetical protein n=1 Tax=Cellulosilyticum sp. I15G10I2 TaxID=1892843 RepID=UPI00085C07F4|nr:hypothetical protein [Cellulosilyticum sp. I15G10I2]